MLILLGARYPRVGLEPLAAMVAAIGRPSVAGAAGRAVCLATCNRAEVYIDTPNPDETERAVRSAWAKESGWSDDEMDDLLDREEGLAAAEHLFKVAGGLESMVLGECEIGGQVARALHQARAAGTCSPLLEDLFQSACRAARRVAAETDLGAAGRSIASVALDLAGGRHERAVIVGTGSFARVLTAELRARGCHDLAVFSPTGRAEEYAERHQLRAIGRDCLAAELAVAGLVALCSGHGDPVLTAALARDVLERRGGKKLAVLDLSLRRDAEPAIGELDGIDYVDLDAVSAQAAPVASPTRSGAERIVAEELDRFRTRRESRLVDPAIVAMREHVAQIARTELSRLPAGTLTDEQAALIAHRISQSILHLPTQRAKEFSASGRPAEYLAAFDIVYGLQLES